jgi:hypothetical protein
MAVQLSEYNCGRLELWTNNLSSLLVLAQSGLIEGDADQQTHFICRKFWERYLVDQPDSTVG